jgi:peroxiredoxin
MPALTPGKQAPDFTLPTLDGQHLSLSKALEEGPVVLAFFKVTCPVCQYAFPFFERLFQAFRGPKITVVGVSQHPKKETALFCKEYGVGFPILLDDPEGYEVSNAYGLTHVPTVFLIAPNGAVEVSSVGWSRADLASIYARLAETTNATPPPLFQSGEDVIEAKAG